MGEHVHIIIHGKKTSDAHARAIAEDRKLPVRYWPYWPHPESRLVSPREKRS